MSEELMTIDEVLNTFILQYNWHLKLNNKKNIAAQDYAKGQLTRIMVAERLKGMIETFETLLATGEWSDFNKEYFERCIAQLTHQAQAGGENEG